MKRNKLNWQEIIALIQSGEDTKNIEIEFNEKKIPWNQAMLLGEHGFKIPDMYIDYDEENINYSDIPELTEKDIITGKVTWLYRAEIPLKKEINDWVKREKIDLNKLLSELVENFYQTIKNIHKNTAL